MVLRLSAIIVGLAWWVSVAFGYQQTVSKNYGVPVAWPISGITMHVNLGCPSEGQCWDKIAQSAIAEWNAVNAPFYIRAVVGADDIPTACASADGYHTLQWSDTKCNGEGWGNAAGYTWSYFSRRGEILEADVRIRRTPPPGESWSVGFFHHVVLHELGHVIGLSHPDEHGQEVEAVMNMSDASIRLHRDDRNGIRGIYGALLWDETRYPTELLGTWKITDPESGNTVRWTATHFKWSEGDPWAYFQENEVYGWGARIADVMPDWDAPETHILTFNSPNWTECTNLIGLYEGANRFTGGLLVGTHKDADGYCTQWPTSRQYAVEWWREPAPQ